MRGVRGLAVDIDGTMTYKDRSVNCNAVEALRRVNVVVVLATGNISCYARTTAKLIGVSDIAICENGGVVRFSYDGDDIVLGDKEKCLKAAKFLMSHYEIEFLDEEYRKSEVCMRRNFSETEAKKILREKFGDSVNLVDSGFAYHITDANVSKGKALKYIAEKLGLSVLDFAAIGDSENDMDLIKTAGIGIAVANSNQKLKEVADIVLMKENGDGIEEALNELGLL